MAIDPSISLDIQTPAPGPSAIDTLSKLQNMGAQQQAISASQTQQQATQAQIPGLQATSEIQQRAAAFKRWQAENVKNYMDPPKASDTGGTQGTGTFNPDKFVQLASRAGYVTEAQAVAASDLSNKAQNIKNATDIKSFADAARGYTAQLVSNAPEDQRAALQDQYANYVDKLIPGTGVLIGQYNPGTTTAARAATMTPLEQGNLGINQGNLAVSQGQLAVAQGQLAQSGATTQAGPDQRDPNSEASKNARANARAAGMIVSDSTTAADLAHAPIISPIATNSVVPSATRAGGMLDSAALTQKAQAYENVRNAVTGLMNDGLLKRGVNLSAFLQANIGGKLGNNANFRALQAAAASMPEINIQSNDGQGILAQLNQLASTARTQAATAGSVATTPTFNRGPGAPGVPPAAPQPAAPLIDPMNPQGGSSRQMKDRQGRQYTIPEKQIPQALNDGLTFVTTPNPTSGGR